MPAFRYVTTQNYGAPGVYIQEREPTPVMRGLMISKTGIAGASVRGPVGRGVEIDSPRRFEEVYGGRDQGAGGAIVSELWKALQSKPFGRLLVFRVAAAAAVVASFSCETAAAGGGTAVLRIDAANPGIWGNGVGWRVSAATDGVATSFNLQIRYLGKVTLYENLNINSTSDNLAAKLGSDDANLVVLTKLAAGRPVNSAAAVDGADADGYTLLGQTVTAFTSVAGTDGAIADSDFTGAGKAMELLNAVSNEVASCSVVGRSNTATKAKAYALAPTCRSGWTICPDSAAVTRATWITEIGSLRHERVWPIFRHAYIRDTTDELIAVEPHPFMQSVLSQTDDDVHPGVARNAKFLAGINSLAFPELTQDDIDALDAAGSSVLERRIGPGGQIQWGWAAARTGDLAVNNRQISQRRIKDYLIRGVASRLADDVFEPNTERRRTATKSALDAWLGGLARAERFVDTDEETKQPCFSVVNDLTVNSRNDRKANLQRTEVRVTTIAEQLVVALGIEAGPDVTIITELAA